LEVILMMLREVMLREVMLREAKIKSKGREIY
jgi:hypothetical protein